MSWSGWDSVFDTISGAIWESEWFSGCDLAWNSAVGLGWNWTWCVGFRPRSRVCGGVWEPDLELQAWFSGGVSALGCPGDSGLGWIVGDVVDGDA